MRTFRVLRVTVTLLCLLLCLASLFYWIRSYRIRDTLNLTPVADQWSLSNNSGTFIVSHERSWIDPQDLKKSSKPYFYDHSFLGFGGKRTQEPRIWRGYPSRREIDYTTIATIYFVPLWFCAVIFSILPLVEGYRRTRRILRFRYGRCVHCGYDLRASSEKCPECGHIVQKRENQKLSLPAPRR
jgi:predicted RNA-binding Zn-ribbon protein involved in translation (DUF1610 family)